MSQTSATDSAYTGEDLHRWGNWEPVIGVEVHVQLATASKIFSSSPTSYGADPNSQANIIDLGMPGVLPVLNEGAVKMAITFGLAIGAQINKHSIFDRKNYFYPDLPKGYQISQFEAPIVGTGKLTFTLDDGSSRTINITRAHLEEDAGKSVHDMFPGSSGIDLNRTGTPLLEVVSEPELRSPAEAAAYFRSLHALVKSLRICDGNLNEGSMRCDANVSIRPRGQDELGERTEIKNVNSFRFVERAIESEIARQIEVLEAGGKIERQTRLYDPDRDETRAMRGKELSDDYRYFPDPDLLPLTLDDAMIEQMRLELPELPEAKRERFINDLGLSEYDADVLTRDPDVAQYFETTAAITGDSKTAANWVTGDVAAALNRAELEISDSPVTASTLGALLLRIADGTVSGKIAKTLFEALWEQPEVAPEADDNSTAKALEVIDTLIEQKGLKQVSDQSELQALVDAVVADNPDQVEQFRAGKEKVLGFFVGQIMKATQGKANPQQLNELLRKTL